jgi:uncharacterized coiled-coil protein SlyX
MPYTLTQASKACGKGKSTLLRAIRSGRISADRDEVAGTWLIAESELHRVFDPVPTVPVRNPFDGAPRTADRTAELEARIAGLEEAQRLRDDAIRDLRGRLDAEADERRRVQAQLTALLTDQRAVRPAAETTQRRTWWRWKRANEQGGQG